MTQDWRVIVPEPKHDVVLAALQSAFDGRAIESAEIITGGASGALPVRLVVAGKSYLLRLEGPRRVMRNPHQYTCMRIAAEAGAAPALHYVDDGEGIAIIDFVAQQPLHEYPGGAVELMRALSRLARTLQDATPFPAYGDYLVLVRRLLAHLETRFAPGLLEAHHECLERLCEGVPWDVSTHVSSHNDPNPRNILFDGKRLWLVDWETAYRNDPYVDMAILVDNFAPTPELEQAFLSSWPRAPLSAEQVTRFHAIKALTRLYYAGLLIALSGASNTLITDLVAPTPHEFQASIVRGELSPASAETRVVLGKMCLAGFLAAAMAL